MTELLGPLTKTFVLVLGIIGSSLTAVVANENKNNVDEAPILLNSIQNSEFDQGTTNWTLGDWTGANFSNGGSSFASVTGAGMSGTNALYINVVNANNSG